MKKILRLILLTAALCLIAVQGEAGPKKAKEVTRTLHIYTTNDIHGRYFDSLYVKGAPVQGSLLAVSHCMDSLRALHGADNVLLIDAGDFLQGDNAAYYFNYVDTLLPHLYVRMAKYVGYDAVTVGNHDVETGHPVYDRVAKELAAQGIPFLASNAIRTDENGEAILNPDGTKSAYFQKYALFRRAGMKVAVLGYTNANIKGWLSENVWKGMTFESLLPYVQEDVDRVRAAENPDVVIVSVHSGTGLGDGSMLESQGLDLFKSLKGADFVVCSHDHRPVAEQSEGICLINSGSHCKNLGHGVVRATFAKGKMISKSLSADIVPINKHLVDERMRTEFAKEYEAVKAFTLTPVGVLRTDLCTRDAYSGMCDYLNLLHTISLLKTGADLSFAAPLTFNGNVRSGVLLYNDLFTIYPYENQLFTVRMSGREIKAYLEASYDTWINTVTGAEGERLLKIVNAADPRTGQAQWSFVNRSYNFDSAGGLVYTVDVTAEVGDRVKIESFAGGKEFSLDATYTVAMTSYRANGGGGLMAASGISEPFENRVVERYPEIRTLVHDYLLEYGEIAPEAVGNENLIGHWHFTPAEIVENLMKEDMILLFGSCGR